MAILTKTEAKRIKVIEKIIQKQFEYKQIPSGMEICEIQLYHLANTIKDTKVNPAVNEYLPAIQDVLKGLDREELIRRMVAVEFNRFYNYYSKTPDLNAQTFDKAYSNDTGETRYFINIGEKDGYDWRTLKDFLRATMDLGKEDIFKVDVKNTFSFFNTEANLTQMVLDTFNNFKLDGRFVNIEISQKSASSSKGSDKKEKGKRDRKHSKPAHSKTASNTGRKDKNATTSAKRKRRK